MDILNHAEAPLNEVEWGAVTDAVIAVARRQLVGRRFLTLYGPLGGGTEVVQVDRLSGWDLARVGMQGENDDEAVVERHYQRVPLLYKDFVLGWRDLENAHATGNPLDWSQAQACASYVALAEDHLILHGIPDQGLEGLLTVEGRQVLSTAGWQEAGSGFHDVARAVGHLTAAGFMPVFTVLAGVQTYALWHRLYGNSGILEIEQIQRLVGGEVLQSPLIPDDSILVVAAGSENMDLAVGLDIQVTFVESTRMNYIFRVLEVLSLRIKRTSSICQLRQES
ncbi:MAG: bacteriocin [Sulfobacillus acidophilus]|uniref:Type 1 encapsulin shell protein n=1 Tax=Sulfobacillus acidophilus TaxID=53633 RepID=A0A2T2WI53_9FIRM|nr:MAG: bacteriocin [Sulfobacillus acidophilus]